MCSASAAGALVDPMANGTKAPGGNYFSKYASRELTGHKKKIYSVSWSPNGKRLASGKWEHAMRA